jgi:hypothetical protein
MKTRVVTVAISLFVLAAAGAVSAGCTPASCEKICETQNSCSGATPVDDCQAACDADLKAAQDAGCESEYKARIDCLGTVNSCATSSFCSGQDAAFLSCLAKSTGTTTTTSTTP